MNDSRILRICDLLLRRRAGQFFSDSVQEEACRQLNARLVRKHPAAHEDGEVLDVLTQLIESDYVAHELAGRIVPLKNASDGKPRRHVPRLLFLSALPNGVDPLRVDREIRKFLEAQALSSHKKKLFHLENKGAVQINEIHRHIRIFRPDIIHFSGHGEAGSIFLEDEGGEIVAVSGRELVELFDILEQKIRCLVLNACETSLDARSIARRVGVVIVWAGMVPDSAAIVFSTHFYEGLAWGLTPRKAFKLAQWQVKRQAPDRAWPRLLGNALDIPLVET
jgi:hypothetical protein